MTDESTEPWRPLGTRDDAALSAAYDTLVDGTPDWLEPSMRNWALGIAMGQYGAVLNRLERRLRVKFTNTSYTPQDQFTGYWWDCEEHDRLRVLDALVQYVGETADEFWKKGQKDDAEDQIVSVVRLRDMLVEGGSAWTVDSTAGSLVRRVNPTAQVQVDAVVSVGTDASRKIAAAWHNCYRIDPQPDYAFTDAVLAVEAMVLASTTPGGTLGTATAHVRDTVARWSVGGLDDPRKPSGETLLAMLQTLWHNQQRHANSDKTITGVTQAEAEAAVSLAVTLVHWFSAGLVLKDGVAT